MEQMTFHSTETAWCPGCGNFDVLETLTGVLNSMALNPKDVALVGGIGQAAKLNQYVNTNGFSGLHGRALPAALGIKMANDGLTVIVNSGDGDTYGEGGNHFLHTIRRNVDIAHFVHDNQIYGLTKGQASPTSDRCDIERRMPCSDNIPLNPLVLALAAGATFVARGFSGNKEHLAKVMEAAIRHRGYALVDILLPCVSFNKINTFAYYKKRVYELSADHDASDRHAAMQRAEEFGERIPIGILYQVEQPTFGDLHSAQHTDVPPWERKPDAEALAALLDTYR